MDGECRPAVEYYAVAAHPQRIQCGIMPFGEPLIIHISFLAAPKQPHIAYMCGVVALNDGACLFDVKRDM